MRRISLREYQESLADRLKTAQAADAALSRLALQAGRRVWLLDLTDISEVIPVPEMLPVPMAKRWLAGLVNIRGNLISVVDFSAFLGDAPTDIDEHSRLVVIGDRHRINSALIFARVIGLRQTKQFKPIAGSARDGATTLWISGQVEGEDGQTWNLLDMQSLVTHPEFLQVEA